MSMNVKNASSKSNKKTVSASNNVPGPAEVIEVLNEKFTSWLYCYTSSNLKHCICCYLWL